MEMTSVAPGARDVELLRAMAHRIDQQDPGAFNNLGVLYHSKGLHANAVEAFLCALALDPRMRTAARNLEIAAAQHGACDELLAGLAARLEADPDDDDARRERARLLRLIGRHAEAAQQLDALIAANPDDAASLFERGQIEQRAGDLRRAQRWFERAVNAAPEDPIPLLHLAEVLYQRGQNEQALEVLVQLLAQCPTIAEAHLLHGFVLGDMGRHEAARAAAQQAASLNPALQTLHADLSLDEGNVHVTPSPARSSVEAEGALARYGLGMAFRQRGYFDEARREFDRALAQGEDARLARHAIAELDLVGGQSAAAKATYEQLLADHNDHPRYWNEHGVALHQSGDVEGAADSYRRALRADPKYALAYNNLAVALSDLGEASAAREALVRATDLEPAFARARLNLARWYVRHRDPLAALTLLRELVAFQPNDADAWHDMGTVLLLLHRPDEARDAFSSAIDKRPEHAEARYALAQVLGSLGDEDGALRETQHALGLAPVRMESRLTVGIDFQHECPEAAGFLDLLAVRAHEPLTGVSLNLEDVAEMLREQPPAPVVAAATDRGASADRLCDSADAFAARGVHGEALERYAAARAGSEATIVDGPREHDVRWRRAAIGEARSNCLLGQGHVSLSVLRALAAAAPDDTEVIALFASSAANAARGGLAPTEVAPILMRRLLRMESPSAALLHFVGDAALSIEDESMALAFYRRALAIDPSRPTPRVAIARILRTRGDLQAARLELLAALTTAPALREGVLELARVSLQARSPADGLRALTKHLSTVPTDLEALVLLVELLIALDREDDARVAVLRVLRHDTENAAALWFDGVLLVRQARMRDAVERWRRVQASGVPAYVSRAEKALARAAARLQFDDALPEAPSDISRAAAPLKRAS